MVSVPCNSNQGYEYAVNVVIMFIPLDYICLHSMRRIGELISVGYGFNLFWLREELLLFEVNLETIPFFDHDSQILPSFALNLFIDGL